ncbi:MAG: HEPN domain-containing protein [bacterium]
MDHLFEKGDYHYALFIGHLVLEKVLKALFVKRVNKIPPFSHSLVLLANKADLILDDEQKEFLEIVTDFNIAARYPDQKFKFYKKCTKEFTEPQIRKIKEYYEWLKSLVTS